MSFYNFGRTLFIFANDNEIKKRDMEIRQSAETIDEKDVGTLVEIELTKVISSSSSVSNKILNSNMVKFPSLRWYVFLFRSRLIY